MRDRVLGRIRLRGTVPLYLAHESEAELQFYERLLRPLRQEASPPDAIWDVGCRNGSYLRAYARVFPRARITGVELDLGRRYLNLYRRGDLAHAYAERLRSDGVNASIESADFRSYTGLSLEAPERVGLASFLFPFVSEDPCLAWGLPKRYAQFEEWLAPVVKARQTIGVYSVHQGEWEAECATRAYQRAGLPVQSGVIEASEWAGSWPLRWDAYWFRFCPC